MPVLAMALVCVTTARTVAEETNWRSIQSAAEISATWLEHSGRALTVADEFSLYGGNPDEHVLVLRHPVDGGALDLFSVSTPLDCESVEPLIMRVVGSAVPISDTPVPNWGHQDFFSVQMADGSTTDVWYSVTGHLSAYHVAGIDGFNEDVEFMRISIEEKIGDNPIVVTDWLLPFRYFYDQALLPFGTNLTYAEYLWWIASQPTMPCPAGVTNTDCKKCWINFATSMAAADVAYETYVEFCDSPWIAISGAALGGLSGAGAGAICGGVVAPIGFIGGIIIGGSGAYYTCLKVARLEYNQNVQAAVVFLNGCLRRAFSAPTNATATASAP